MAALADSETQALFHGNGGDQLKFKPKRRRDRGNVNDAELKALEALEKKEGKSKLDDN